MKQEHSGRAEPSLADLGFTAVEAAIYGFLLQESPASGYRIAQALGKPPGGVYKALEGLHEKGAVLEAHDGESRVVRAVPPVELLGRLAAEFEERRAAVLEALTAAPAAADDRRVYAIRNREQFFARVRAVLAAARQVVVATCCPAPLAELVESFVEAWRRGVAVGVKVYAPVDLGGAEVVVDPRGLPAVASGPGQWVYLVADGWEVAGGLLSHDGGTLREAFWTTNALLGWSAFSGLSSDIVLAAARQRLAAGADRDELARLFEQLAPLEEPRSRGKQALGQRYGQPLRRRGTTSADE